MNLIARILLALMALSSCFQATAEPPAGAIMAPEVTTCPNGHANLGKIPIVYGLLSHLGKAEKDFTPEERKLAGQIKRHEIIWGGCCIDNHSPDHLLRCQQCGFEFRHHEDELMKVDFWNRKGTTREHCKSLSPYAQKLAAAADLRAEFWMTDQQFFNKQLMHEQIDFEISPLLFEPTRAVLLKWANGLNLPAAFAPPALEQLQAAPFRAEDIRPDHYSQAFELRSPTWGKFILP